MNFSDEDLTLRKLSSPLYFTGRVDRAVAHSKGETPSGSKGQKKTKANGHMEAPPSELGSLFASLSLWHDLHSWWVLLILIWVAEPRARHSTDTTRMAEKKGESYGRLTWLLVSGRRVGRSPVGMISMPRSPLAFPFSSDKFRPLYKNDLAYLRSAYQ